MRKTQLEHISSEMPSMISIGDYAVAGGARSKLVATAAIAVRPLRMTVTRWLKCD
jgi:hypothetical protein